MTELGSTFERETLSGGRVHLTQHMRPICYLENGGYQRILNDWVDGDQDRPHIVTRAPFLVSVAPDGKRRIHPTREFDRYFEFGAPYIKPAATWQKVNLGAPTRSGNMLTWTTANANLYIQMAGHYVKLAILLKGGWQPPGGQFAFPVGLTGLTRQGGVILADGKPVMSMRLPHVEDYDNPEDKRPIAHEFVNVSGQWYVLFTLPSLAGMSRPLVDPTISLQPDDTTGLDARIIASGANTNYNDATLSVGEYNGAVGDIRRSLIKFSLTTLPDNAKVSSATLTLSLVGPGGTYASNNRTLRIYRQLRAWVEAQATWNQYSTGNNWGAAGGFDATDCEQTSIGSHDMATTDADASFHIFPLTPTTKAALDLGNGWMIKADTELNDMYEFCSSAYATANRRPQLDIVYSTAKSTVFRRAGRVIVI